MRVSANKTIQVSDVDDARESIVSVLNRLEATIEIVEQDYVEAKLGSQAKLRLKGATMAKMEDYPIVVMVKFSGGSELQITVGENLGFGSLLGMKGKYQEACDFMLNEVLMNVKVAESAAASDAAGIKVCPFCAEEVKAAAVRCKHCGSDI